MKKPEHRRNCRAEAFTLIELLLVIVIIGILAALTFTVMGRLKTHAKIEAAKAELAQVQTAIEAYKARYHFYPPDNPDNPALNQLFFELKGTILTNSGGRPEYVTLDGSGRIDASVLSVVFGPNVTGIVNYPRSAHATDEDTAALSFLNDLRPNQTGQLVIGAGPPGNALLVCSVRWTDDPARQIIPTSGNPHAIETGLNPWRYVSSHPTNNPAGYDLWVDLPVGTKTYRVSNWSRQPQVF